MKTIESLKSKAEKKFGSDDQKKSIANRAIELSEEWAVKRSFTCTDQMSRQQINNAKRECRAYVKAGLYKDYRSGTFGSVIAAILFQLLVNLIVKWIIDQFFEC